MSDIAEIESLLSGLGAHFVVSIEDLQRRLERIEAFVFDWDGVFNRGEKGEGAPSSFSEPDSMGTNLLRYAFWRARGKLPVCAIVSGADNPTARSFARREHFTAVYTGFADKTVAFEKLESRYSVGRDTIAYLFDDANDFSAAAGCGLRCLVRRDASPLLREYAVTSGLVDYVTAARAGEYPVREVAEMLVGLFGDYRGVFGSRHAFDAEYQAYFSQRQAGDTEVVDAP
jgi:3-deoxy-D-manno-octulosonate 8-phosphate phosphatase (KDO 8-P phosphatase)